MKRIVLALLCISLAASLARADEAAVTRSTKDDQRAVALTIYNVNLGLVKDEREIAVGKGLTSLQFMDVAASID